MLRVRSRAPPDQLLVILGVQAAKANIWGGSIVPAGAREYDRGVTRRPDAGVKFSPLGYR